MSRNREVFSSILIAVIMMICFSFTVFADDDDNLEDVTIENEIDFFDEYLLEDETEAPTIYIVGSSKETDKYDYIVDEDENDINIVIDVDDYSDAEDLEDIEESEVIILGADDEEEADDSEFEIREPSLYFDCKVNNEEYESLNKAFNEAKTGDVITLLRPCELEDGISISDKDITLDLNGYTVYNTEPIFGEADSSGNYSQVSLISVATNGKLTINDGYGNGGVRALRGDCFCFDSRYGGELIINNGTYIGDVSVVYTYQGSCTINGGDYSVYGNPELLLNISDFESPITVNGGTYHGFNPEHSDQFEDGDLVDFVPDGYQVESFENTWWVIPVDDFEKAEEEEGPGIIIQGESSSDEEYDEDYTEESEEDFTDDIYEDSDVKIDEEISDEENNDNTDSEENDPVSSFVETFYDNLAEIYNTVFVFAPIGSDDASGEREVTKETWSYSSSSDEWTLDNRKHRAEWVYAYNPYADTGIGQEDCDWFYFDENGIMKTGWITDEEGNVYYLNPYSDNTRGKMLTGWQEIDGELYYFDEDPGKTQGMLHPDKIDSDEYYTT